MSTLHDILRGIVGAIDHFSEKTRDDLLAQIGDHEAAFDDLLSQIAPPAAPLTATGTTGGMTEPVSLNVTGTGAPKAEPAALEGASDAP